MRTKNLGEEFVRRLHEKGRNIDHIFIGRLDKKFLDPLLAKMGKQAAQYLARFFMLSIGKEILSYRERILDRLSQLGSRGEEALCVMMDELSRLENSGFPDEVVSRRRMLYPKTVEAARAYFLALQPSSEVSEGILERDAA